MPNCEKIAGFCSKPHTRKEGGNANEELLELCLLMPHINICPAPLEHDAKKLENNSFSRNEFGSLCCRVYGTAIFTDMYSSCTVRSCSNLSFFRARPSVHTCLCVSCSLLECSHDHSTKYCHQPPALPARMKSF